MKELEFVCEACGGDTLCCDQKRETKQIVVMERDGSVSLEAAHDIEDDYDENEETFTFYCDDCKKDIFNGTLGELEDELREQQEEREYEKDNKENK